MFHSAGNVRLCLYVNFILPLHMQTVELTLDIWAAIRDCVNSTEWAMACGTCRATRALSRPLVAAEVYNVSDDVEHDLNKQLQLDRWSGCHSLFLNLRHMPDAVKATAVAARIEQLSLDGSMSSLQCLHIIGRGQMPLTKGSIEGLFVRLLAKHASVLTLDVRTLSIPLILPKLQHLILDLDAASEYDWLRTHETLFPAFSNLAGLRTLFVQSSSTTIKGVTDLTACAHLRCVALQGVELKAGVALPVGCLLHVLHRHQHHAGTTFSKRMMSAFGNVVTGVTMKHSFWWSHMFLTSTSAPCMRKLRRLQLIVNDQCTNLGEGSSPLFYFSSSILPALKVLELDVQCNLEVCLNGLALESFVVIAAGALKLNFLRCELPMTALKQMYLRSGAAFLPGFKNKLEELYAMEPKTQVRLLDHVRDGQEGWISQVPANFQPNDLQQCWCGACSDCLVRAGVPILCDQAWTSDGFEKRLRPHCGGVS